MAKTITLDEAMNLIFQYTRFDDSNIVILYDKCKTCLEKKIKLVNKTAHTSAKLKTKCIDSGVYGYLNEIRKVDRRTPDNVVFICVPYENINSYIYELTNKKDTVYVITQYN